VAGVGRHIKKTTKGETIQKHKIENKNKNKVKQSRYRPGVAQRVPGS